MRKFISNLFIIFMTIMLLVSCGDSNNKNDSTETNPSIGNNDNQESITLTPLNSSDFLGFTIVGLDKYESGGEREYLVTENKDSFKIDISLNNPNAYKINSVVVLDKKYQSDSLVCTENNTHVAINIDILKKFGYKTYDISKIYYQMNDEEKYIDINSSFVLKYQNVNKVIVKDLNETITSNSYDVSFNIYDEDNVLNNMIIRYVIVEKNPKDNFKSFDGYLKPGNNSISVDNLDEFHEYAFFIVYYCGFEQYGGTYINETFFQKEFTTKKAMDITNVVSSYDNVKFDLVSEKTASLIQLDIREKESNKIIETVKNKVSQFNNLYSNRDYVITYYFKQYDKTIIRVVEFKTKQYVKPEFTFVEYNNHETTISYEVKTTDNDLRGTFKNVEIYRLGKLVDTKTTLKGKFTNLIPYQMYVLKANYTYDLNDGKGTINEYVTQYISTLSLDLKDIALDVNLENKNTICYNFKYGTRTDVTFKTVELYLDNKLIDTKNTQTGKFVNLLNDKNYTVKANYEILLEDGENYKTNIKKEINTAKINEPIVVLSSNKDKKTIDYDVSFNDPDSTVTLRSIELYNNNEKVKFDNLDSKGTFTGLLSNTNYTIKVNYTVNYNNGLLPVPKSYEKEILTDSYTAPKLSIVNPVIGADTFTAELKVIDNDHIAKYNNTKYIVRNMDKENDIKEFADLDFNGLNPDTNYKVTKQYRYNLNNGNHDVIEECSFEFKTLNKFIITSFEIVPTSSQLRPGGHYTINITYKNHKLSKIQSIYINNKHYSLSNNNTTYKAEIASNDTSIFKPGMNELKITGIVIFSYNEYKTIDVTGATTTRINFVN